MIWLKRLLPFVLIGVTVLAYYLWDRSYTENRASEQETLALVTAQVWVATATYRDNPEQYMTYRDSLLEANNVSVDEVMAFLKKYEADPEDLLPFGQTIQRLVDSLARIEDSLYREARIKAHDSVTSAANE